MPSHTQYQYINGLSSLTALYLGGITEAPEVLMHSQYGCFLLLDNHTLLQILDFVQQLPYVLLSTPHVLLPCVLRHMVRITNPCKPQYYFLRWNKRGFPILGDRAQKWQRQDLDSTPSSYGGSSLNPSSATYWPYDFEEFLSFSKLHLLVKFS